MIMRSNRLTLISLLCAFSALGIFVQSYVRSVKMVGFDLDYYANASAEGAVNNYKIFINWILSYFEVPWILVGLTPTILFFLVVDLCLNRFFAQGAKRYLYRSLFYFAPFLYLSTSGYRDLIISSLLAACYLSFKGRKYILFLIFCALAYALRDISIIIIFTVICLDKVGKKYIFLVLTPFLCIVSFFILLFISPWTVDLVQQLRQSYSGAILNSNSNFLSGNFFYLAFPFDLAASSAIYFVGVVLLLPVMSTLNFLLFTSTAVLFYKYWHLINFKTLIVFISAYFVFIFGYCVVGYAPSAIMRHFCMLACAFWIISFCNRNVME